MLRVSGLDKKFGSITALDGVSLTVERGQLLGFLGPNGAGKTTTMRAVLGLLGVDAGTIEWDGARLEGSVRTRVGYMPEERGLYPRMPILDQVVYFARLAGRSKADATASARTWLDRLGLGDRLDADVQALSHGNQQRVQLAVALAHGPELLVLDEPFSGLDPIGVDDMKQLLADESAKGTAVLFSSHQLDLVEDICRDVVIINRGRVVLAGEVDALRAASDVRNLDLSFARSPDPAWFDALPGAVAITAGGIHQRLTVPAALDVSTVLDVATAHGEVTRFSLEPPDLSEVFRRAVGDPGGDGAASMLEGTSS